MTICSRIIVSRLSEVVIDSEILPMIAGRRELVGAKSDVKGKDKARARRCMRGWRIEGQLRAREWGKETTWLVRSGSFRVRLIRNGFRFIDNSSVLLLPISCQPRNETVIFLAQRDDYATRKPWRSTSQNRKQLSAYSERTTKLANGTQRFHWQWRYPCGLPPPSKTWRYHSSFRDELGWRRPSKKSQKIFVQILTELYMRRPWVAHLSHSDTVLSSASKTRRALYLALSSPTAFLSSGGRALRSDLSSPTLLLQISG